LPIQLETDASTHSVGAVLLQKHDDGEFHAVAYESRKLSPAETRYSITDKELVSATWATGRFHSYLWGTKFTLVTDHAALQYVRNFNNKLTPRLVRMALKLEEYDYEIVHRPGKTNVVADGLSRLPARDATEEDEDIMELPSLITSYADIHTCQQNYPNLMKIYRQVENNLRSVQNT